MDVDVQVSDELEQERKVPWAIIPGIAWVVEKQRKTSVRMSHFCQDEPLSVRMSHFRSEIWISEHPNAKREFSSLDREVKWENIGWCIFLFRSCALASLVVCFVGVTFLYLGLSL